MADITSVKSNIDSQKIAGKRTEAVEAEVSLKKEKKLKKACTDFESIFYYYVFKGMRQTIPQSGFLKQSPGKDTYNIIFDQKVAEGLANRENGSGLQKTLFEQLSKGRK